MSRLRAALASFPLIVFAGLPASSRAETFSLLGMDVTLDGYVDARLVVQPEQETWIDGGLGKTRFGDPDRRFAPHFVEAVGRGVALITPELMLAGEIRIEPQQQSIVDLLEAYVRYRPVSTTPWRWSVKIGTFFPPISLENDEIGWTSGWTLTPSAINSWVGEELRTIGGEGTLEWRRETGTVTLRGAVYGWNDPAGIFLTDRGWALHDRPTGLFDHLRLPDAIAIRRNRPFPIYTLTFEEIDDAPGWYAGLSWDEVGIGRLDVLYYDNRADPTSTRHQVAWKTDFWSVGFTTRFDEIVIMAQGMTGSTIINPSPTFYSDTGFWSAYGLVGWEHEDWRLAGRVDLFGTTQVNTGRTLPYAEKGHAFTLAATYFPYDWLRLTAEALVVDSTKALQSVVGLAPRQIERQFQLGARFYL